MADSESIAPIERVTEHLLEVAADLGTWDELPVLLWAVGDDEGPPMLVPVGLGDDLWAAAPVPDVLEKLPWALRVAATQIGAPDWLAGVDLLGLVLIVEVWRRQERKVGPDDPPSPLPPSGSLADDPNAREARMCLVVTPDGGTLFGTHVRGEAPERVARVESVGDQGRVPAALRGVLEAMVSIRAAAVS